MLRTALLLLLSATAAATACDPGIPPAQADAPFRQVSVGQLKQDLADARVPLLLDVRTPTEFADGHVPGAKNLPLSELKDRLGELEGNKDREIYVICHSGNRSQSAARTLLSAGFKPVDVAGGTSAWRSAWYEVE